VSTETAAKPYLSLDEYILRLQELSAQGHGNLPVCICEENAWEAISPGRGPAVAAGEYIDDSCTWHDYRVGPYISAGSQ
jgi:hypothetical protein